MENLKVDRVQMVGGGRHMRLRLKQGREVVNAIYFSAGASGVSVCVFIWVQPMDQWHVARELRKLVVQALQAEGITIPYPVTELITKEVAHGN
jgi:small-conductance mechanosensitive channel